MKFYLFISLVQAAWCVVCCYRILIISTTVGRSHHKLGIAMAKCLLEAGNDVTVISSFRENNDLFDGKFRNIFLEGLAEEWFEFIKRTHPNLKVFITHAGVGSIMEAVRYGVPILTLPYFFDQFSNAVYAEYSGYAINIPFKKIGEHKLLRALNELLNNSKYREKAKEKSVYFVDRPMKPKDLVVYWTEFIIRNRGAPHLRVAAVDMPYYKYFLIDIITCLVLLISFLCLCLHFIIRRLLIGFKFKQD